MVPDRYRPSGQTHAGGTLGSGERRQLPELRVAGHPGCQWYPLPVGGVPGKQPPGEKEWTGLLRSTDFPTQGREIQLEGEGPRPGRERGRMVRQPDLHPGPLPAHPGERVPALPALRGGREQEGGQVYPPLPGPLRERQYPTPLAGAQG